MSPVDEHRDDMTHVTLPGVGTVSSRVFLIAAVSIAALLRIAWAMRYGLSIEMEGAEYARIAESLLAGRGYVGVFNNGTQLNFPPLYPLLIAAVTFLIGNSEHAARVINVAFGAALVIPMFRIAQRLYGERVATSVAAMAVFHPALIAGGASAYAEGPYLTLLISGVLWVMKWVEEYRPSASAMAGIFFGLAYLVRPEAFLLVGVFAGCGLVAAILAQNRRAALQGVAGLTIAFLLVALPNIVFLTLSSGKLRIEAKGTLAYLWGSRINAGMSYEESTMGIGEDLSDQGVFMKPNLEVINSAAPTTREYFAFLLTGARRNIQALVIAIVAERAFGSPCLFALVILGLFGRVWGRQRVLFEAVLLLTIGTILFVLFTVQALWFRYFYSLFGILLIWGAKGADNLYEWGRASITSISAGSLMSDVFGRLLKWGSVATVLFLSLRATPYLDQFRESLFPERVRAGRWIAAQSSDQPWIMDSGLQVAYYAGGNFKSLPYASSDVALRYIEKHKPDFIVLHSVGAALPYVAEWLAEGIPDKRAVLVHTEDAAGVSAEPLPPKPSWTWFDQIKVYRWIGNSSGGLRPLQQ